MTEGSLTAFLAGAAAGLSVDISLFPIDTIKTRVQSAQHGTQVVPTPLRLFAGLPAVLVGSAPGAAIFFLTYEAVKFGTHSSGWRPIYSCTLAACIAEVTACVVRVPCEVLKQRAQSSHASIRTIFSGTLGAEGVRGLYRGYLSTVLREVPFSFIQFPTWECLKFCARRWNEIHSHSALSSTTFTRPGDLTFWQSAICGSLSGGIAGALTTPLDVAKTRIMLAKPNTLLATGNLLEALKTIFQENGLRGLFAGLLPRTIQLSLGGAIFLGMYDLFGRVWSNSNLTNLF